MARLAAQDAPGRLLLAGGSFYRNTRRQEERLRAQAGHRLGERVTFSAGILPAEVARLMAESAVVVLPSRAESFGAVLVEALASRNARRGDPLRGAETSCKTRWVNSSRSRIRSRSRTRLAACWPPPALRPSAPARVRAGSVRMGRDRRPNARRVSGSSAVRVAEPVPSARLRLGDRIDRALIFGTARTKAPEGDEPCPRGACERHPPLRRLQGRGGR